MQWAKRTWKEIPNDLAAADHSAMLPVGATEQHGPHLATGMDFVLADHLCRAVAAKTKVPTLPVLPYGLSLGHSHRWPGTIAITPVTLINFVKEIGDWAYASGVRRLFIVNSHVTNGAPLRCALEMLRSEHDDMMIALVNTASISERVRAAHFADAGDWHANAAETALMMAIAPEIVRADLVGGADDPDRTRDLVFAHPVNRTSRNGVTGTPSRATVEQGRELFGWMVDDLAELVERGRHEVPPLPHSYSVTIGGDGG